MKKVLILLISLSVSAKMAAQDTTTVYFNNKKVAQAIIKTDQPEALLQIKKMDIKKYSVFPFVFFFYDYFIVCTIGYASPESKNIFILVYYFFKTIFFFVNLSSLSNAGCYNKTTEYNEVI